jgi:single-strand DNA-binding protein
MASLNRVFLIGNLTADPELRYTPQGTAVCSFRLAVNRKYKDQQGQTKDETCFLNITVWGKQGENCASYLSKGRRAFVEGRLRSRSWQTEDGQKRTVIEVVADRVQFLDAPSRGAGRGPTPEQAQPQEVAGASAEAEFPPTDDDIPF